MRRAPILDKTTSRGRTIKAARDAPTRADSVDPKTHEQGKLTKRKQTEAEARAEAQLRYATPRIVTPRIYLNRQQMAHRPLNVGGVNMPDACCH